jgi:hypothetical protein
MRDTTVVVDISVITHSLADMLKSDVESGKDWRSICRAQINYILTGHWLVDMGSAKVNYIFVQDTKPYWRTDYLLDPVIYSQVPQKTKAGEKKRDRLKELIGTDPLNPEYIDLTNKLEIHYKAGRKFPEKHFTAIKQFLLGKYKKDTWEPGYLETIGCNLLYKKGYEADDFAAAVVKVNDALVNPNRVILLTVDSDWSGLINDHTLWFCSHGWPPRVRGNLDSLNSWAGRRLKVNLENCRDIWDVKAAQGDKSDNLPASAGVLIPVIDLLNPPEQHKLWLDPAVAGNVATMLSSESTPPDTNKVIDYLRLTGKRPIVRPLDNRKDFHI